MKLLKRVILSGSFLLTALQLEAAPVVQVAGGEVRGFVNETVAEFRGIPYAAQPVGLNRFRGPQALQAWDGVKETVNYKPACIAARANQGVDRKESPNEPEENYQEEACLYLNVAAPSEVFNEAGSDQNLPVMVWIHGGGWTGGAGDSTFDSRLLVNVGKVVVVKINYRLGALGFAWHRALNNEGAGDGTDSLQGNYGLRDTIQSLKWVEDNISQFGGDPENVTVFGESAGGWTICSLLASPEAKGLFDKAIIQSGGCPAWSPEKAEIETKKLITHLCGDIDDPEDIRACLRLPDLSGKLINFPLGQDSQAAFDFNIAAVIDGKLLNEHPLRTMINGEHLKVPIIIGINENEVPALSFPGVSSGSEYRSYLESVLYSDVGNNEILNDEIALIRAHYNYFNFGNYPKTLAALQGDTIFRCQSRRMANAMVTALDAKPLYRYEFAVPNTPLLSWHAAEIPFLFNPQTSTLGPKYAALQVRMLQLWTSFSKHGVPQANNTPAWDVHSSQDSYFRISDVSGMASSELNTAGCNVINSIDELNFMGIVSRWQFRN